MSILISGSLAYDYIMDFPDTFKNHIMQGRVHMLNVCFVVDELKKHFGGTAGNIGYTMKLLGAEPIIASALGKDAEEYLSHLRAHGIETDHILVSPRHMTASAHITTDKDDNQITAFYSGAAEDAMDMDISPALDRAVFGMVSPTKKEVMIAHAKALSERGIPFCFDPGQQVTAFTAQELMMLIGQSTFVIGNDYEMALLQEKTGWDMKEMLRHTGAVITTLGARGSVIRAPERSIEIAPCPPRSVDDPTGAGDAYRAGFFASHAAGHDLETCGRVGSVAATYAVERTGTQNHSFTTAEFEARYKEAYGNTVQLRM